MNPLTRFFRRMVRYWIDKTPGIGNLDAAEDAVRRSDSAVKEVKWHRDRVEPDVDYVLTTVASNHFREKVVTVWTSSDRRHPHGD